jgi:hypothetical protein
VTNSRKIIYKQCLRAGSSYWQGFMKRYKYMTSSKKEQQSTYHNLNDNEVSSNFFFSSLTVTFDNMCSDKDKDMMK